MEYSDTLKKELVAQVRKDIGPFAAPDVIHWAPGLPKTRSGKIMRRVLRKIASNEEDSLGERRRRAALCPAALRCAVRRLSSWLELEAVCWCRQVPMAGRGCLRQPWLLPL